jgi:hypothetical protein
VALTTGTGHTCALRSNGTLVCWGFNSFGQLGNGTKTNQSTAVPVVGVGGLVVSMAAGVTHTCALRSDGVVRCWGSNVRGQLAIDSATTESLVPVTAAGLSSPRPRTIAAGDSHACAVLADGTVRCWGLNDAGQLGDGTFTDKFTPVTVSGLTNVAVITAGSRDTCALRADGAPFCWGRNVNGELGRSAGTTTTALGEVPSFRFNIDPAVELAGHGRVATVTALVNCEEGDQVQVRVSVTQGSTVGHGVGLGACTGGLEGYEVTVPAQGRAFFTTGPAHAEADAIVRSRGTVVDEQAWTRDVQIEFAP